MRILMTNWARGPVGFRITNLTGGGINLMRANGLKNGNIGVGITPLKNFQRWNSSQSAKAQEESAAEETTTETTKDAATATAEGEPKPRVVRLGELTFPKDDWSNITPLAKRLIYRKLHLQPAHPIGITRALIEAQFPTSIFKIYNDLSPIVSPTDNFDNLGFPSDHPSRSKSDTFYINESNVLRTHTSAHQLDIFRKNESPGFLISADVYRRDEIDRIHYPVFHQMEGVRTWDFGDETDDTVDTVLESIEEEVNELNTKLKEEQGKTKIVITDPTPTYDPEKNPIQKAHEEDPQRIEVISSHLKRTLELAFLQLFSQGPPPEKPLEFRWKETFFPFTSPSYELEVLWGGEWLELLGCGIVNQDLPIKAGIPSHTGWAFGLGLERIAMLLFRVPDIRLFWAEDDRFKNQFTEGKITLFEDFSKFPSSQWNISFWFPSYVKKFVHSEPLEGASTTSPEETESSPVDAVEDAVASEGNDTETKMVEETGDPVFHEEPIIQTIREIGGDIVEQVQLRDVYISPKNGAISANYKVTYRSFLKTLTKKEVKRIHGKVSGELVKKFGVRLR